MPAPDPPPRLFDAELARRWEGYCERWAERMERHYGEDFGGDAPIALWRAVERFDPSRGVAFQTFLTHTLRRYTRGIVRRARRHRAASSRLSLADLPGPPATPDPGRGADRVDGRDLWESRRGRLTPRRAEAVRLILFSGLSERQAGAVDGTTGQGVGRLYRAALAALADD